MRRVKADALVGFGLGVIVEVMLGHVVALSQLGPNTLAALLVLSLNTRVVHSRLNQQSRTPELLTDRDAVFFVFHFSSTPQDSVVGPMTRPSAGSLVSVPFSLSSTSSHHSKQSGSSPEAHQDHHAPLSSGTSTTEEGLLIEEDDCALCRNYTEEDGLMLQCAACRSQGHPSCLQMSDALANACRAYDCVFFLCFYSHGSPTRLMCFD